MPVLCQRCPNKAVYTNYRKLTFSEDWTRLRSGIVQPYTLLYCVGCVPVLYREFFCNLATLQIPNPMRFSLSGDRELTEVPSGTSQKPVELPKTISNPRIATNFGDFTSRQLD